MVQAFADQSFLSTVGINTSITMIGSAYQNYAQMINALSYLNINQVRDTYDNFFTTAEFPRMASQLNLKFDFFIALGSAAPEWQLSQIKANASIVSYVEGYNESDSWWQTFHGATGVAATQAVQEYIYATVKSDPALSGVGVIQATFASPSSFPIYGDMSAYADYASTHTYFGTGNNPSGSAALLIAQSQTVTPGRPTITTEAGYQTTLGNVHGVSELVQAKYELDLLFEQAKAGVKLTYLWELADNYADPDNANSEDHYGLFNNDWTPKLAAIALHNTMQIMADPGLGNVTPGALDYAFDGLPGSVQSSLYQKSDGTFVLVVWNDVRLSGPALQGDIAVAPIATMLRLGQSFAHIAIFDPLTGTAATQSFANASAISLQVVDHPLIIELSQNPAFYTPSAVIAAPGQIITNPLQSVQVDGLSVTSASAGNISVRLQSAANALSVLDANGYLFAQGSSDITLTGSVALVDAELASLTYTGGNALGSDVITVTRTGATGLSATRSIPVLIESGTTAIDSGGVALSVPSVFAGIAGLSILLPRLTVADTYAATHAGTVTLAITATSGTLQIPASIATVFGGASSSLLVSGSFAQIAAALGALSYTAAFNVAHDTITYDVTDQTGFSSTASTAISVNQPAGAVPAPIQLGTPPTTTAPLAAASVAVPIVAATVAAPEPVSAVSAIYRFFDTRSGTQFLTASTMERDSVIATRPDLVAEGLGITALSQPGSDTDAIPVFRFFDMQTGTHFYTSSSAERDTIAASRVDLEFEGISFYEHQNALAGDAAVYRFFNAANGTHFYTANETERSTILATRADLVPEGIAFYAPGT